MFIFQGVLQPENIAIHVAQNAVNFISSTLAWLAIGAFASQTSLSGKLYTASQKHESTLLHTYVLNVFLTADRSCTTNILEKNSYTS